MKTKINSVLKKILEDKVLVTCLKTDGLERFLTIGKKYEVVKSLKITNGFLLQVKCDTNRKYFFNSRLFDY